MGVELLTFLDSRQGTQTRAITADAQGLFCIWDIGNGQSKVNHTDIRSASQSVVQSLLMPRVYPAKVDHTLSLDACLLKSQYGETRQCVLLGLVH